MASYHCCVPQCTNDARCNKNISFHNFPSDINRKKQWLVKIRRDEGPSFQVKTHTKVCSAHFLPGDFVKTLTGMKCLTKQATPSVFSWSRDTPVRKPPTPRSQPTKRKKLESSFNEESVTVCERPCVTPQSDIFTITLDQMLNIQPKRKLQISPASCATFVSSLYAGSISDKEITKQSGIIQLHFTSSTRGLISLGSYTMQSGELPRYGALGLMIKPHAFTFRFLRVAYSSRALCSFSIPCFIAWALTTFFEVNRSDNVS